MKEKDELRKKNDTEVKVETKSEGVFSVINNEYDNELLKTKWILDTGATQHVTNDIEVLYDKEQANINIGFGNNEVEECTTIGKVKLKVQNTDGETKILILENVAYIKNMVTNCISYPVARTKGFRLHDEYEMYLKKRYYKI